MKKCGLLCCLLLMLHTSANTIPGSVREFIHLNMSLSWYDARIHCQNNFKELFRVSETNVLKNLTGSAKQLSWIGLYRGHQSWKWVDKTKTSYFNWYKLGDCASITTDGLWHNRSCNDELRFVCEHNRHWENRHWVLIKENKTWNLAKQHCDKNNYSFAIIYNASNNKNVSALLESRNMAWIGLTKDTGNIWRWINNENITYSNWLTSFLCAIMDWRGFWHDCSCFEEHPFVCFGKGDSIPEYKLVNEEKTWKEAQSHCEMLSMNLVMVKTQENITALLGQIQNSSVNNLYFWIGLYNDPWYWSEGSSTIRNWHSTQPDDKDLNNKPVSHQRCAAFKDGEWFDEGCLQTLPFFCSATVRSMILVSEPKSWEEALEHCRDKYIDLASLASNAEQLMLMKKLKDVQNDYFWIGLRFLSGSWFWVYGDSLQYKNWLDGGQQQCPVTHRCGALAVASGKWEARPCEERLSFLCFQK